jgi:hypothetical protein
MPIKVKLPNGTMLASSATSGLVLNNYNPRAQSKHLINGITNHSLLSCGQMCDAGYKVIFDKEKAKEIDETVTLHGRGVVDGQ